MFVTKVSVIIPVSDGHAVKACGRNGSKTPGSINLCLKSTWINFMLKYVHFLPRLYLNLFTRHLYCSQRNVRWLSIKQHLYRNTFGIQCHYDNFCYLIVARMLKKSEIRFGRHRLNWHKLSICNTPKPYLRLGLQLIYLDEIRAEVSDHRHSPVAPSPEPHKIFFFYFCEVILKESRYALLFNKNFFLRAPELFHDPQFGNNRFSVLKWFVPLYCCNKNQQKINCQTQLHLCMVCVISLIYIRCSDPFNGLYWNHYQAACIK
jgi:hypothetical protein